MPCEKIIQRAVLGYENYREGYHDGILTKACIDGSFALRSSVEKWACGERNILGDYVVLCIRCAKALGVIW